LSVHEIKEVSPNVLETFFHYCKKELEYSYSMMKQLLASVEFLYEEVLQEGIDFDFTIKMKTKSYTSSFVGGRGATVFVA